MTTGEICFNPDLLQTDRQYLADVDKLTQGSLVEPDYPCVPVDEVPSSFILNSLDPADSKQVRNYFVKRPYYQTLACLWEKANFSPETSPWVFKPLEVSRGFWAQNPDQVVHNLGLRPALLAVGTISYLLTEFPQTDRSLTAISLNFGDDQTLCSDFILMGAYQMARDSALKQGIAQNVMSRYFPSPSFPPHIAEPIGDRPLSLLWEEQTEHAFPILKELFESTGPDRWLFPETTQTLAFIGGSREYEYLTQVVLTRFQPYGEKTLEYLLQAAKTRREVMPYLARIMDDKDWRGDYAKETIIKKMHTYSSGILPDSRLLPGLFDFLVRDGGRFFDREEMHEDVPQWIARCGERGNDYLLRLLKLKSLADEFRKGVIRAVVAIDDSKVQTEIKKIVRGEGIRGDDQFLLDLRYQVIGGLAVSKSPVGHRTLMALIDEFQDKQNTLLDVIARNVSGAPLLGIDYYLKMDSISKNHPDEAVKEAATRSCDSLAVQYREAFSRHFEKFSAEQQKKLVDQWVFEGGIVDIADYRVAGGSPKAKAMLRTRIRDVNEVRFDNQELRSFLLNTSCHPAVKIRLLDQLAKRGESGINFLISMVKDTGFAYNLRIHALHRIANSSSSQAESFLVDLIQKKGLPEFVQAATEALKARAENPRYQAKATLALHQAFPL